MVSLLIVPILALILFNSQTAESNVEINIRSSEIEYLTKSIEEDLDRFIEIAGKRALIAAVS